MVKKILSILGIIGILSTMSISTAFAADDDTIVKDLVMTPVKFNPNASVPETAKATFKAKVAITTPLKARVKSGSTTVIESTADVVSQNLSFKTVVPADCDAVYCNVEVTWNGKNAGNTVVTDGNYTFEVDGVVNADTDTDSAAVEVFTPLVINSLSLSKATWDPAKEDFGFTYSLTKAADVTITVLNGSTTLKTLYDSGKASGTVTWAKITDKDSLLLPGISYSVKFEAKFGTETKTDITKTFTVAYTDSLAPKMDTFKVDPSSFNAESQTTTVSFNLTNSSYITAEVALKADGTVVNTIENYDGTEQYDTGLVSFSWDGKKDNGDWANSGQYMVKLTARNSVGVATDSSLTVDLTSPGSKYQDGLSKIKSIELDPSATQSSAWDPLEDKLEINWETTVDFDNLKVEARKGSEAIEVYEESDIEADEYDSEFEGKDDDDEYIEAGTWKLVFVGEIENNTYYVEKTFYVKYEKPSIDDTFVTKKSIDPDIGEGTYFGFILETDALVDVEVLKGSTSKVDLLEDEEVKKDVWYAVYWDGLDDDGDDFDYDDTFKIRLTAKSLGDEDVSATATESVDLDEDDVSSSKSNVTMDSLVPPVVEQGNDVALTFNVEDDAELRVGIWKGTSTSGSPEIELQAYKSSKAGDYEFTWDTHDEDGKLEKEGFYTYKVFTKKGSTTNVESESGQFVIGDIGDVFGGAVEATPVVVDEDVVEPLAACGFSDVAASNKNCTAIKWAKEQGIFVGDSAGFRPYDSINRAEVLAVIMRAFGFPLYGDDGTNLGWKDTLVGSWYMSYLRSGKLYGLLSGYTDGTVRPANSVTRVELLKFIYEAAKKAGVSSVTTCTMNPYADVYADSWYLNYVCQAKIDKLFDVIGDMFLPNEATTRAEVAEALYRLLK